MEEKYPLGWEKVPLTKGEALERRFTFPDFKTAWRFMEQVAVLAESMQHHPEWENTYNRLVIRLSTHDQGHVITSLDLDMAHRINRILLSMED
jgi:4a-hydroxytetrahydrobiopterin dehydratase